VPVRFRSPFQSFGRPWALICALTLLSAALMLCLDGTRDGDLYLQLASGRFISAHGLVAADPFQTVAHGQPWLNQQWLAELGGYDVARSVGVTGLTILYAALLAAPLALLLWLCRRTGVAMLIAVVALYCPGAWMIVHPRAAAFSMLGFSLLVAILALHWLRADAGRPARARLRWVVAATLLIFAVWANLHGGFVAGLILIAVATCGLALEWRLGIAGAIGLRRIGLLALTGVLATATVTVATPLGDGLWSYLASFGNPAIALVSAEWRPAFQSPFAISYIVVAGAFAFWLYAKGGRRRSPATLLVVVAFLAMAVISQRNAVYIGPVLALLIASIAPERALKVPPALVVLAGAGTVAMALVWALTVGPARNEPLLDARLIGYALKHPPARGHIASYAGVGSYMLWRSPRAPVVLDGWLEHFSEAQLRGTYSLLDGRASDPTRAVRRLGIGAAIVTRRKAIDVLRAQGFAVELRTPAGSYLVKR
jgi:hypothetical protein